MDHSIGANASGQLLVLDGEWDLARKAELKRIFDAVPYDQPLMIDVRGVTYADSAFLGALATLARRLRDASITLLGANDGLKRVLTITQLDRYVEVIDA